MTLKRILPLLLIMLSLSLQAQNWEKMLGKADDAYNEGDYLSAQKDLEKFKKKVIKKLGPSNEYMPEVYVRQARLNLATGVLMGYQDLMKLAMDMSIKNDGPESVEHAKTRIDVARIIKDFGNYKAAREHLEETKEMLERSEKLDDDLKAVIDLEMASILAGQGYFKDALELMDANEVFISGRAVDRVTYIDDKGKLKSRRLEDYEVLERYNQYATLLTQRANTYRFMGDFHSADSAFIKAQLWIDEFLGKTSEAYIKNQLYMAKLFEENGMQELPKEVAYDKLLSYLQRDHNEAHYLAFELYEGQLKEYLRNDQTARFKNLAVEYERAVKKNFPKNSFHRVVLETVDFEEKLNKNNTTRLYADAAGVIRSAKTLPEYHPRTAKLYEYMYRAALANQNFAQAEAAIKKILDIKTELYGANSPEMHLANVLYANYLISYTDKLDEAGNIYEESFNKIIRPQINFRHKDYLDILENLAKYYQLTDQYDKAALTLKEASEAAIQKYQYDDYEYGIALENIADLRIDIGLYDEATEDIKQSLEILEEFLGDEIISLNYAKALETNARLLAIKGYFDEAEDNLDDSRKVVKRSDIQNSSDLEARIEIANLNITLGNYRDAEESLLEAVSEYQKLFGENSTRLMAPLTQLARINLIIGDYPKAEKLALQAKDIGEKYFNSKSTKLAPTLALLTDLYTTLGDYDKAEVFANDEIQILTTSFGNNHIDVANAKVQLGLIKFYRGDNLDKTEKIMAEARDIVLAKLGNRNPIYANLLIDIAKIYIAQKKYDEAFNGLSLAQVIWENKTGRRNNINLASIFLLTGDLYYQQRNYSNAEENYEKARRLYNKFFHKNHPDYVKAISKLAKLYYMEGDNRKARKFIEEALANYANYIEKYFPALSEREKAKFWNTIQPDYEFYATLAFNLKEEDDDLIASVYDNTLLTKALLLNTAIKTRERILNSGDEELKTKFLTWLQKKEELTNILSMSMEELQENGIDPIVMEQDVERLEKDLSQSSEVFSSGFDEQRVRWQQVQQALQPNEVAVEMLRYRYFDHTFTDSVIYAVMHVSGADKKAEPKVTLLKDGKDLEQKYFKFYRNSIVYRVRDPYSYEKYWKPIEDAVGSHSTIYLSADGVYNQINLEAIPVDDQRYVLDNSNIIMVSNTKDIYFHKITTRVASKNNNATMFGNPQFYLTASTGSISPLPGTEEEIKMLDEMLNKKGWSTEAFLDMSAREEKIKELNNPKIFHVATHGFYSPKLEGGESGEDIMVNELVTTENPLLRTGLLLSGAGDLLSKTAYNYNIESGILTAYEAMNLNLDETELVVLSACETGLGEMEYGEGVYGLQRAFLVAGAETLIMSMFKVDDKATQELMTTFYEKWLTTGQKRQSFIDAKKEIRVKYQDPIYWGAFIMIGLE